MFQSTTSNITSHEMYTTDCHHNLRSSFGTNRNQDPHREQNANLLNTFNHSQHYGQNIQHNEQQRGCQRPGQYSYMQQTNGNYSVPLFSNNSVMNSTQRDLTQQQISARQTVPKELPLFTGNPEEWPLFSSTYDWSTNVCGLTDAENLVRLQKSLRGDALKAVQHILIHPSCVSAAIST